MSPPPNQNFPNYTADIREGVAVEYVTCEPISNILENEPEFTAEERKEYAYRVMARHKAKKEQA